MYGNTYVWLQNGRPVAVGCMFRNFEPWNTFNGELAALAGTKLVAKRDDKVMWQPKDEWKWQRRTRRAGAGGDRGAAAGRR